MQSFESNDQSNTNDTNLQNIYMKVLYAKMNPFDSRSNTRIHFHPFTELYYIVEGRGRFSIEDSMVNAKEGDFIIINSNIGHSIYPIEDTKDLKYLSLGFDSISIVDIENEEKNDELTKFFHSHISENNDELLKSFKEILDEFSSDTVFSRSMANAEATILFINLLRKFENQIELSHDKKVNKQIDYIKNYIDSNYSEDIKLETLSSMAFMNKFHLIAEFKQAYRVTPIEYLILKRIEITKNLLISTNHSMDEISSIVGFNSQSYFNQVFKKKVGITPSKFRKNHRI